jgi:hypothetical protein
MVKKSKAVPAICHGGTRWGWVVSVTPRPRFTPFGTHWIRGWVGPRAGLDAGARRKILCPCRGSDPDRPARSQTLHCLSYRGSFSHGHSSINWIFLNSFCSFCVLVVISSVCLDGGWSVLVSYTCSKAKNNKLFWMCLCILKIKIPTKLLKLHWR